MVLCCAVLLVPIHLTFSPPSLEDTFISKLINSSGVMNSAIPWSLIVDPSVLP